MKLLKLILLMLFMVLLLVASVCFALGLPVQIIMVILKACNVGILAGIAWNNIYFWIPAILCAIGMIFRPIARITVNSIKGD